MSLDEQLRDVIERAAAPISRNEIGVVASMPHLTSRRRVLPVMVAAMALTGLIALAVTFSVRSGETVPSNSSDNPGSATTIVFNPPTTTVPAPIVPPAPVAHLGTEYPIERIGPLELDRLGPVQDPWIIDGRSERFWQTADATLYSVRNPVVTLDRIWDGACYGALDVERSDPADPTPTVTGGSSGCTPAWVADLMPLTGGGWTQTDGSAGHGIWQWTNVPADTDFVQFTAGEAQQWQRPVEGMAAFPATQEDISLIANATAYRADGAILATANLTTMQQGSVAQQAVDPTKGVDPNLPMSVIDGAQANALNAFDDCLASQTDLIVPIAGGPYHAQLPPGAAGDSIWSNCITTAQASLDAYMHAHAGNPSDATTEPTVGSNSRSDDTTAITTDPTAVPTDVSPTACPNNNYTGQLGDTPDGIASRYGINREDLAQVNPHLGDSVKVGQNVALPCTVITHPRSTATTGLSAFTELATRSKDDDPGFVPTNSITLGDNQDVYVIAAGSTGGTGTATIRIYDRASHTKNATVVIQIDNCTGPIVMVDNPSAPLEAQPYVCTADGLHHTMDLLNQHTNQD